jgi:hypothetical protein
MQNPSNKQCERFSFLIYRHLTPTTMQSCDAIVGFNWFSAFTAFARTVSFGPVVNKCLKTNQIIIGVQFIAICIWKSFFIFNIFIFCLILLPEKISLFWSKCLCKRLGLFVHIFHGLCIYKLQSNKSLNKENIDSSVMNLNINLYAFK